MELSWREIASFSLNWGILEEKTHDFRVKWGIHEEETRNFHLNGGFAKRKHVFFASMWDSRRENA